VRRRFRASGRSTAGVALLLLGEALDGGLALADDLAGDAHGIDRRTTRTCAILARQRTMGSRRLACSASISARRTSSWRRGSLFAALPKAAVA
jgi:hypothetical protein